jgi:RNA polymerase sigma-70 factor, ECF subfamily
MNPREPSSSGCEASDLELLQGIAAGSPEAFRSFYRRWAPRLGPFLMRVTGSPDVTEDLLQEAFLRILRAAPRFELRTTVSAWVYRICANLAYSHWRRIARAPFQEGDPLVVGALIADERAENPADRHVRQAFREALTAALEQLPANQRLVFLLKADRGLTYEEIAAVLQCPEGTAKSRFHYAVLKLREELQPWCGGLHDRGAQEAAEIFLRHSRS